VQRPCKNGLMSLKEFIELENALNLIGKAWELWYLDCVTPSRHIIEKK